MSKRFEETFTKEDLWMEKMHKKGNTHHLVNREMEKCRLRTSLDTTTNLTLSDPMDCSPPGSCVHGILQKRILEWVAMPSSRVSPQPRDQI